MKMFWDRERKLSERMKKEAVDLGLCAQWTADWDDGTTKDEMAEKFVQGLDFCIGHDWPSTEVMKRYFGDVMHKHGVYVDERLSVRNIDTLILNGRCDASVTYVGASVGNVYVRHTSRAKITVRGFAYVHVSVYDGAKVEIDCEKLAKCFVYRYGGDVKASGNVVVRERDFAEVYGSAALTAAVETAAHEEGHTAVETKPHKEGHVSEETPAHEDTEERKEERR